MTPSPALTLQGSLMSPFPSPAVMISQIVGPYGTLLIETDPDAGTLTIYADPVPHPEDWRLVCGVVAWLTGSDAALRGPEFIGELDVWTAAIDSSRIRYMEVPEEAWAPEPPTGPIPLLRAV